MPVDLVIGCEIGFRVLPAGGLALRYLAGLPRLGAAVLLCEAPPELTLSAATAPDLRGGGEPERTHGLAAPYLGYAAGYGHYTVKYRHAAYRFGGGPKPPGPLYGKARARHEWRLWARTLVAVAVAPGLLQAVIRYAGDGVDVSGLRGRRSAALRVLAIHAAVAATYTFFPRKAPAPGPGEAP
ncbi:hypothetical protein [Streptomyces sp. A1136]|uniref:hypothetical protein n=1 Tax=Streptomyces sp. A1136 TaxID=2563102 RepID=UPI00109E4928|nr:hypothetical protein [Streptomyces sp. A1136]THA52500.1 hypothetical protein E6R62_21430 [Streptomyces sp. A1136]